ncbi:hypothetical protein [Chryseobacterium arthrosphaerae]|uniref:hypothetical protein n=1 Tax=Chryseobacterium arthrosphaerae TaxID=651561 RepID=UPI0031D24EEA
MNTTQSNTKFSFLTVESKISRFSTIVLNLTLFGLLFSLFMLFVLGPVYGIYKRGWDQMLYPALVCWGISLLILVPAVNFYIVQRKKIACKIIVDDRGLLFYNAKNEMTDQILYEELQVSDQNFDVYTVTPVGGSIVPLLEITVKPDKKEKAARRIDMNLSLCVVKNKFTLYAHFLHGISVFRPDLTIDPMVLRSFSIDPNTWEVNKKGTSLGGWLLILAAFIICAVITGIAFLL